MMAIEQLHGHYCNSIALILAFSQLLPTKADTVQTNSAGGPSKASRNLPAPLVAPKASDLAPGFGSDLLGQLGTLMQGNQHIDNIESELQGLLFGDSGENSEPLIQEPQKKRWTTGSGPLHSLPSVHGPNTRYLNGFEANNPPVEAEDMEAPQPELVEDVVNSNLLSLFNITRIEEKGPRVYDLGMRDPEGRRQRWAQDLRRHLRKGTQKSEHRSIEVNIGGGPLVKRSRRKQKKYNNVVGSPSGPGRVPLRKQPNLLSSPSASQGRCDHFSEDLCLDASEYPREEILRLLAGNARAGDDLVADVSEQNADLLVDGVTAAEEDRYTKGHYFGVRRDEAEALPVQRDFAQDGGYLCPSEVKYARPKRGKTAQGVWKDIVNVDDYTQTLRMEKCLQPGGQCSYVSHHFKSQCSQVYNFHRLLSWDKARGLHMDIYKVPTCCSCHIMGYSYVFPPLDKKVPAAARQQQQQFRPTPSPPVAPEAFPHSPIQGHLNRQPSFSASDGSSEDFEKFIEDIRIIFPFKREGALELTSTKGIEATDPAAAPIRRPPAGEADRNTVRARPSSPREVFRGSRKPAELTMAPRSIEGQQMEPEVVAHGAKEGSQPDGGAVNYGYHPIIEFFRA